MPRIILIVDDITSNRLILREMLKKDYDVLEASGGQEALDILSREGGVISAVLLDVSMPGIDGFEVLGRLRADKQLAHMPVIMITGSDDKETRIKSLSLGANDFVMKPYSSEIIKHCLENNIALHEAAAAVSVLEKDRLTGLWNREAFFERAGAMISKKPAGYYMLGCLDVEGFKVINDQYGNEFGDRILKCIADAHRQACAEHGGLCGHLFADQFICLYPRNFIKSGAVGPGVMESAVFKQTGISVTISVGGYVIDDKSLSVSAMFDRAAIAKSTVKGRYDTHTALYDESMRDKILYERTIVNEMNGALSKRQFEVWFQPQYNHSTDAMIGAEALVRWRHPRKGLIPPASFIGIFEQNGFIYALDKYVWEETCRYLRKWLNEGRSPLPVSVNISRYDMLRPDLVETLCSLIRIYDLPIELLRLEITESAFSESSQQIVEVVRELLNIGFTVEIDDFGSGYSSLNTLKDVPAQILKLDMKFLEDSNDSQRGGNIVESVVRMAKWLGMSVIAEGVETLEQANYLRSIGCSYMQGFLYARPMSAQKYEEYCNGSEKEEHLLTLETVANLNNNSFWDPASVDTLIFNSYVGGACIYEYHNGNIELLRATEKYAQIIGSVGMTVEDALNLNWMEHLDSANREHFLADLDESVRTKSDVTGEYVFLDLPGCPHETYLRSTMRVIATAGERYLVYCTNENITAQRIAEQKERLMSEEIKAIMDNVDLGISAAILDGDSAKFLFTNDRYYDMLGFTREQFEAEIASPFDVIAPEDRQRVMDEAFKLHRSQRSTSMTYHVVTRDGRRRLFRNSVTMGRFSHIEEPVQFAIMRDITEEDETARREHLAAQQIKNMMDDIPGGFVRMRVDSDGGIRPVYMNEGFLKLSGASLEEAMALYADDALAGVHPDDLQIVKDAVAEMFKKGEARSGFYRLQHGGGDYVWLSFFGRVTKDTAGGVFLNIYYTDASDQVNEEETQKALLDNLPAGAGVYDLKNGQMSLAYQNKSFWVLVGLNKADFLDPQPMSAVHPDDIPVIMRELTLCIEQHRDVSCDIRLRHLTRGFIPVHLAGRIICREPGWFRIFATFTPRDEAGMSYQQTLPLLLSAIMGSTTDLSFAKDRDFRYLTCSRAFANMVGYDGEQDIIGKTDHQLFDAEMADKFRRDDEELIESGKAIIDMMETIPSKDGTPRYSSTSKYLLRDGSGQIIGLFGTGRDITRSVVQDSQLKLVNDSVPGGLATYAFKGGSLRVVYCNDGFCELFGGSKSGFNARKDLDPMDWVFEEDREPLLAQINSLAQQGTPMDCVFRIHVIGGDFKWVNEKAVSAELQGGAVLFNAILLDITERQSTLEALRMTQEENSLAARLGGGIVMRYIVADRSLHLSPEVAAAHSLPEELEDVPYGPVRSGLIAPESTDAYVAFFEAILNGSDAGTILYRQHFFGDWRWMEGKSSTIFSGDGKPVKAVISLFDVTEQMAKETVYKKWQHSLEDRAPESYTLFRCNLNANTSYDSKKGTLISFDFDGAGITFNERARQYVEKCVYEGDRNSYMTFTNSDSLLAGYYRGKRADALEYRELLSDGGSRWLRLSVDLIEYPNSTDVEAYLMYENIDEAKKTELQTKELSETDPLTGLLNRSTFVAKVDAILRASKPGTRHALLMIDIDDFKQVNDVFGHSAGDQTLVDLARGLRSVLRRSDMAARLGGDEFVVFLSDISEASAAVSKATQIRSMARRSFSMEVQTSASIGIAFFPGDGMDFSSLYKNADSALYHVKGSGKDYQTVYSDNMADENLSPEPDTLLPGSKKAEKKRRMLIVDDSVIDYALLQHIFLDEFLIERAKDGNTALIRLRHYGPAISVVLLDLMMPGMDGYAVLEKMQGSAELRNIPVIIVSGDESRQTCLETIRKGATDFITKPVDTDLLRIRVHSAISKAENQRLRAKNSMLELMNDERVRYESALEKVGITFVEFDWLTGEFVYYPSISKYLYGNFDHRAFWQILLSDMTADTQTVQDMQQFVHRVAESAVESCASKTVRLKTPVGSFHDFRMTVRKLVNESQFTNKLIIALDDLDYEAH